ncbi:site-specific DNA-methyltransferase [Lactobacillus sp.]|uniref:DNA-methyltransferase n=1 Tax=Lactobacillus sp. TaxID=1591 RepID=UPI0019B0EE40|nr:site-specific DNA-methyltransferase [Lactobacillus sp.]MBD5429702.1 site-specific DNA-methyltransferase [Lactobacillus sp.]
MIKRGDKFILGNHRLMCGDSTNTNDVNALMNGNKAILVICDPPYGMKKDILYDDLEDAELNEFNGKWISNSFSILKQFGSWYCWGWDERLMMLFANHIYPKIKSRDLTFKNLLVWDKINAFGMHSKQLNSYAKAKELCLFVEKGYENFNSAQNFDADNLEVFNYLRNEAEKAGLTQNLTKQITGTQMHRHWFNKSEWTLITKKHYLEFQNYFKEKDFFLVDWESLKKRVSNKPKSPFIFNNTFDKFNDVFHFFRTQGKARKECFDHPTVKPVEMMERIVKASSNPDDVVVDLFSGSGSTLIACENSNRKAYVMELDPKWVERNILRWEKLTGKKARKVNEFID